ncbi:ATP-dependent RNA helicase [Armillaria luteobubalina]|uniref:RNA helicase n=1 Tax=Armillaria luteobubalina TaxID=153913 RepID=A0AA39Q1S0_9AGAR|nr:ATP-dependent RNA helicase [Armillaria luteobubalina]
MADPKLSKKQGVKRKSHTKSSSSRKKIKIQHNNADDLAWTTVKRPFEAGVGGDDGILELEEVEDVEVVYEETEKGRVARFNVLERQVSDEEIQPETSKALQDEENTDNEDEAVIEDDIPDSKWNSFSLHPHLLRALHSKKFLEPTPIQAAAIPFAIQGRDVVGIAQTGSGKTLAYGLPILHYLLSNPTPAALVRRPTRALILAPTRELALQVSSHLNECLNTTHQEKKQDHIAKKPPIVSVAAIVGGMSSQKQRRVLDRGVDVLVATPGRLWDIMEDDDQLSRDIRELKFLVLDEADRMIENGHFAELENILRLTLRQENDEQIPGDDEEPEAENKDIKESNVMQTFVFSATLSKDLQRNVKKRMRPRTGKKKHGDKPASTLDELLLRLDFRDPEPEVIDLSPKGGVVSTLKESKIECLSADKDVYLYYFLLRYPGRSLVFLSSIDGIRRLLPLTEFLNIKAFPLHSQLEQRQRLKNLDRFKATPNSCLLATDIAARGLGYSFNVYIHRNGRTARAMMSGFSMLLCAPDERRVVKALLGSIGREENEVPEMSVELGLLDKLKPRVQLARQIESAHHKAKKANHERNWMKEAAEAMEIELGSDFDSESESENPTKQKLKAKNAKVASMKAELKTMLAQPLIAKGISTRYITSGSRPIVDDLIAGEYHEAMLGVRKSEARTDLALAKQKRKKKPTVSVEDGDDGEEWHGVGT